MLTMEKAPYLMHSSAKLESYQKRPQDKKEPWITERTKSKEESPSNQLEYPSIINMILPIQVTQTMKNNI